MAKNFAYVLIFNSALHPFRVSIFAGLLTAAFASCAAPRSYTPLRHSLAAMQKDFRIFRKALEGEHPGMYWYTPKDSMDAVFDAGYAALRDSMSEQAFRLLLIRSVAAIRDGHTAILPSKKAARFVDTLRRPSFPLGLKLWPDTAVVLTLFTRDAALYRGLLLKRINGKPVQYYADAMMAHLSADGLNTSHKYQVLSNGPTFGRLYNALWGYEATYRFDFIDSTGRSFSRTVPGFRPVRDTGVKVAVPPPQRLSRRQRRQQDLDEKRSLRYVDSLRLAVMDVSTFSRGARLTQFFRKSFGEMQRRGVQHLVIDLRYNGGGSVSNAIALDRYLARRPFRMVDSLYTRTLFTPTSRYQPWRPFTTAYLLLFTRRRRDGMRHFVHYERKRYHPRTSRNFGGNVYFLSGGNSFSASGMAMQALHGQPGIHVVGEESGGGAHGFNAWLSPEVVLPATGVKLKIPLFRVIIDTAAAKGFGVQPTLPAVPSVQSIRQGRDVKMEAVLREIQKSKSLSAEGMIKIQKMP